MEGQGFIHAVIAVDMTADTPHSGEQAGAALAQLVGQTVTADGVTVTVTGIDVERGNVAWEANA